MAVMVETTIEEAAQALGPLIRAHADEAERERRLARPVVEALATAGLLRLNAPRSLGGLEVDPVTLARLVEIIAGFDSAAGWALMSANSLAWWCARLPDDGAEEIYAETPDTFMAASYQPLLRAVPVDGGFRVSGRSVLTSGCHEARWHTVLAQVLDGDGPRLVDGEPEVVGVMVRAAQSRILDTWDAWGMRGTDSHDIELDDVFVPHRRTFGLAPEFRRGRHYQGAVYRSPWVAADGVPWVLVAVAVARAALDEVVELAQRKTPTNATKPLRERAAAQAKVGLAEATLQAARLLLYDTLERSWRRTLDGEPHTLRQKGELLMTAVHAMQGAVKVVELAYSLSGTNGVSTSSPLGRHFRDLQVLKQHIMYSESRYETVGQVLLGVPPDFGFVAF